MVTLRKNFDVVVNVVFWSIWRFRNKIIFDTSKPRKDELFNDIRSNFYFWINNKRRNMKLSWDR